MSLTVDQLAKPLKVSRRVQETPDSVTLVLAIPPELKAQFHYQAGQFVTFFLNINGEPLSRSYSLCSSPLVDDEFKITVKKVPGGRGSTYLCDHLKVGDTLMTTPPSGHFFKPSLADHGTHYFLFAAGSGITPVYSILKTVLLSSALNRVTLIFSNRNQDAIIYRQELERWAAEHPARLDVIHVLSKPDFGWPGRSGRLERGLITEIVEMPSPPAQPREYYLCGPVEFMHLVRNGLSEIGIAKDSIKEENFGVAVHRPAFQIQADWVLVGPNPKQSDEVPEKLIAIINGQTFEVAAQADQSVLETLIEAGAEPPYSCMDGACMACLGKVQQGQVYQKDPGILSDDNIRACETLTCQARPLSKIVKISYDNL